MTERRVIEMRDAFAALAMATLLVTASTPSAAIAAPQTTMTADRPTSSATLLPAGSGPAAGCDAQSMLPDPGAVGATGAACVAPGIESGQAYLVETARPGATMLHQGLALAIARLHPMFVRRLAETISEARAAGLPFAGIFSAYRPAAFGVGGFADKFSSLHTYGLAVDMLGVGGPGSSETKHWYEIAARHGIVCPYGSGNRREWNHCQPTGVKSIMADDPLRGTVSPRGPIDVEAMFAMGDALVNDTNAGAASPQPVPVIDEKWLSRNQGQPRPQGAAGRGAPIKTRLDHADLSHESHRRLKSVAGTAADHLHEAHGQPKRRGIVENAAVKSGAVRKDRASSLLKRNSFAGDLKPYSSNENAHTKRIEAENGRLDHMLKGICRGC